MPQISGEPVVVSAQGEYACGCGQCLAAHPDRGSWLRYTVPEHPPPCTCAQDAVRMRTATRERDSYSDPWTAFRRTPQEERRYARAQIHSYSYRPEPVFQGQSGHSIFYGMELEVTTSTPADSALIVADNCEDLVYLKRDGSVRGFEMVSHPLTYEYWMEQFPWRVLPALAGQGCQVITESNGIHIHVSRDGFSSPAHAYSWLKLFYRNPSKITSIAGRDTSWGTFRDATRTRRGQMQHVKNMARLKQMNSHDFGMLPPRDYQRDTTLLNRYEAINTSNPATFEVRVFAATLSPHIAKGRLQLVAASVEYTREVHARDLDRWSWPLFQRWVCEREEKYPDLAFRLRRDRWRRGKAAARA